jgi:hypothetical protein
MRYVLTALMLGASLVLAAPSAFANDKTDATNIHPERVVSASSGSRVATAPRPSVYVDQREENFGQ